MPTAPTAPLLGIAALADPRCGGGECSVPQYAAATGLAGQRAAIGGAYGLGEEFLNGINGSLVRSG